MRPGGYSGKEIRTQINAVKNPRFQRSSAPPQIILMNQEGTAVILSKVLAQIKRNIGLFNGPFDAAQCKLFPNAGDGLTYTLNDNVNWLAGFGPGLLWLSDAVSEAAVFRETAVATIYILEAAPNTILQIKPDWLPSHQLKVP